MGPWLTLSPPVVGCCRRPRTAEYPPSRPTRSSPVSSPWSCVVCTSSTGWPTPGSGWPPAALWAGWRGADNGKQRIVYACLCLNAFCSNITEDKCLLGIFVGSAFMCVCVCFIVEYAGVKLNGWLLLLPNLESVVIVIRMNRDANVRWMTRIKGTEKIRIEEIGTRVGKHNIMLRDSNFWVDNKLISYLN